MSNSNSYPPRQLPRSVKIKLYLGGRLSQIGWFILGSGMIFFWIFGANADYSAISFNGELSSQTGSVIESEELDYEVNERSVYRVYYRFITPDGTEIEDYSFSTGTYYKMNQTVSIEYPKNNPQLSRIKGLRRSPFGLWLSLTILFPLSGVFMIVLDLKKSRNASQLLSEGILTTGKLTSKQPTNMTVNEQRVYKLTFTFKDENSQEFTVTEKTHDTDKLEDDTEERILYLREMPQNAMMFDTLPGEPELDSNGNIALKSLGKVLSSLLWPILVLAGNIAYYFIQYI